MSKLAYTVAAINAVLALLVLLNIPYLAGLTQEQLAGVDLALNAIAACVAAWIDPRVPFGNTTNN